MITETNEARANERACAYRVLRYTPNLVRDEWVNIGVLVFDPQTGERRLRLIEEPEEYARVRRLHPRPMRNSCGLLRDDLENRFAGAGDLFPSNGQETDQAPDAGNGRPPGCGFWESGTTRSPMPCSLPRKRASTPTIWMRKSSASNADHVAPARAGHARRHAGQPRRDSLLLRASAEASAPVGTHAEGRARGGVTFPGDPMRLDYGYRRNGTRGFVQALSVTRAPADAKLLAYTVDRIRGKVPSSEFTAVTDVGLARRKRTPIASSAKPCATPASKPWRWKASRCGPRSCAR